MRQPWIEVEFGRYACLGEQVSVEETTVSPRVHAADLIVERW